MSILRARWRSRFAVGAAVAAVVSPVMLMSASPASAATDITTGNVVVSSPSTGKVAADTGKQVIMMTVTVPSGAGEVISEDNITNVSVGAAPCDDMDWYIVTGGTQIAVKTPDPDGEDDDGCPATTIGGGTTGETIRITFASGNTLTKTNSNLVFVAPPAIAATEDVPVITENSAALDDDDQVKQFVASGGQYVRIKADPNYTFNGGSTAGLAVTIGGKALTDVKAYSATNTVLTGPGGSGDKGNYIIGKTATGMTTTSPTVVVSQGGVSKTFNATRTGITIVTAPTVTALSIPSVKAGVATNVTVTGTGFVSTAPATTSATVCGAAATVATAPNTAGTSMVITVPADVVDDADGLGDGIFAGACPVRITANGNPSVINEKSIITIVKE